MLLVIGSLSNCANAAQKPLWELSVGGGAISVPYYRGASSSQRYLFPFLLPIYRGRFLQVDDRGVRGKLFASPSMKLELSADANIPARSSQIPERQGMPNQPATVQLGPSLAIQLWSKHQATQSLIANFPARSVLAIDHGLGSAGMTFSPHLTYYRDLFGGPQPWRLGLTAGLEFGSSQFHNYYYGVAPEFSTLERPAFRAAAGFAGSRFAATLQHETSNYRIIFFTRFDDLNGAIFVDSPLVGTRQSWTAGVVMSWALFKSTTMVSYTPPDEFVENH